MGFIVGDLVGVFAVDPSQQSRIRPVDVGQHSPSSPRVAQTGLEEHWVGPVATGLSVGLFVCVLVGVFAA